ncbi:class I SAM-dependent methyltransferase [Actinoalloteichus sp. AHMU CJ021]|uniref:SAM-dependent methyltransferase n=1 Tax=Actinoalloteichus TaxID=65496 RepID=UPI00068414DD|nr:class I SAM-dependent methyltransferase [Actinoalloteichus caeruleus]AUS78670.1 class I SAM-dependent methyltransferase [Actinoalloteichus sp. AHMU CJ021]
MSRDREPAEPPGDPYSVTAEFYDLLHLDGYREWARTWLATSARRARLGVLEVGSGTGAMTWVLAEESEVPVHAVEPSRAMRAVLMGRLATASDRVRSRVRVHPHPLGAAGLAGVADLAVCVNLAAGLPPAEREDALWPAVARALVPGGLLVVDSPRRGSPAAEEWPLPSTRLGPDVYTGTVRCAPGDRAGPDRWTFRYQVLGERGTLREETETFPTWPLDPEVLDQELRVAGFLPAGTAGGWDPEVPAMTSEVDAASAWRPELWRRR